MRLIAFVILIFSAGVALGQTSDRQIKIDSDQNKHRTYVMLTDTTTIDSGRGKWTDFFDFIDVVDSLIGGGDGGGGSPECLDSLHQDFDGDGVITEFPVTNFSLIDPTSFTAAQVESKYLVDRNGLIMRYDPTPDNIGEYAIDFATQKVIIDPDFPLPIGDNLSITVMQFNFFQEFGGDDVSYQFEVTECGVVDPAFFDNSQIESNYLVDRNGLILRFNSTATGIGQYSIDFAAQEIEVDPAFPLLTGESLSIRN